MDPTVRAVVPKLFRAIPPLEVPPPAPPPGPWVPVGRREASICNYKFFTAVVILCPHPEVASFPLGENSRPRLGTVGLDDTFLDTRLYRNFLDTCFVPFNRAKRVQSLLNASNHLYAGITMREWWEIVLYLSATDIAPHSRNMSNQSRSTTGERKTRNQ